jgi:hypothetical protein
MYTLYGRIAFILFLVSGPSFIGCLRQCGVVVFERSFTLPSKRRKIGSKLPRNCCAIRRALPRNHRAIAAQSPRIRRVIAAHSPRNRFVIAALLPRIRRAIVAHRRAITS